jgi:hypothetical protein
MLGKGPQHRIARKLQHSLVNKDCAYLSSVIGTQISKYLGRKNISRSEDRAIEVIGLTSAD